VNTIELGKNGRYRTNVWDYAGVNTWRAGRDADLEMHPTVKPTALVIDAIKDCSRRGDIVLDAFSGSGTTIIAAHKSRRRARAIELDPLYVDVAVRRWQTFTGEAATLATTGERFAVVEDRRSDPLQ
jgi:DNA modification methylase